MVKRSPILGYNHNVRYRGLVFHVQTEDSGVLSPHLFTHLFYGGTIISTRKLVYDAGSAEDAIKALMQAQHKAVMKDLKNGSFDEKIDAYLGGVEGLEPRSATVPNAVPRGSKRELTPLPEATERATTEVDSAPIRANSEDDRTTPVELSLEPQMGTAPTIDINAITPPTIEIQRPQGADTEPVQKPRTKTAERGSKGSSVRFKPIEPPLPEEVDPPPLPKDPGIADAIRAANRTGSSRSVPPPIPNKAARESAPEISIEMEAEESARFRTPRDTAVESSFESDGIPRPSERSRTASQNAATLPPAKKPSRPAISPPAVMSRPITNADDKSGAVEIYAPAPASAEPPPGERADTSARPGQYSVSRRNSEAPIREKTGRIAALGKDPIPAGLTRPRSPSDHSPARPPPVPGNVRVPQPTPMSGNAIPRNEPNPGNRSPHVTAPISSRTGSPSSGVVMTRPAVIVGAPPKGSAQTPPRIRKAREDEGRGFGQGLISEKSLDEVILAYLSEDGDDK